MDLVCGRRLLDWTSLKTCTNFIVRFYLSNSNSGNSLWRNFKAFNVHCYMALSKLSKLADGNGLSINIELSPSTNSKPDWYDVEKFRRGRQFFARCVHIQLYWCHTVLCYMLEPFVMFKRCTYESSMFAEAHEWTDVVYSYEYCVVVNFLIMYAFAISVSNINNNNIA